MTDNYTFGDRQINRRLQIERRSPSERRQESYPGRGRNARGNQVNRDKPLKSTKRKSSK